MAVFEKILVPVDGSRFSLDAVCLGVGIAKIHEAQLRILHVVDMSLLDQLARVSEKNREAVREELHNSAQGFLRDMQQEAAKEQVPSQALVTEGAPHEEILREAASWGADLIIMGKLGRRGIAHILLGSVAERVIEFADVPVLVVK